METSSSDSASPSKSVMFDVYCDTVCLMMIFAFRLLTIYDCRVVLKWSGKTAEGEDVAGRLTIPEVSHEITLDGLSEYVVRALALNRNPSSLSSLVRIVGMVPHNRPQRSSRESLRPRKVKTARSTRSQALRVPLRDHQHPRQRPHRQRRSQPKWYSSSCCCCPHCFFVIYGIVCGDSGCTEACCEETCEECQYCVDHCGCWVYGLC